MNETGPAWQLAWLRAVAWTVLTCALVVVAWRQLAPLVAERDATAWPWIGAYALGLFAAGHAGASRSVHALMPTMVGVGCIYIPSMVMAILAAGEQSADAVGTGVGLSLLQLVPFLVGIRVGARARRDPTGR